MANVGYATLQIIPSVRGIGDELRRQLIGPADDAGEQAGEAAGSGFADTFKGALAAIGVAAIAEQLGSQFTEAFSAALEQSHVKKTLTAQLGSTGKDAAAQGKAVGALYAKGITETFEQGAEAVRAIVSGGLVRSDAPIKEIERIGAKFTDVANTFGLDMNLQSQAVAAMLKNRVAGSADVALDILTTGLQKLGPNAEDLLETFQEYSVQLRKLGIDGATALGLFRQGIQGGARDTDIIADGLKEFSIRAIDMSQTSQDAYKALGLNAEQMSLQIARGGESASAGLQLVLDRLRLIKDPVAQNAAAVGLFGTQAEDMGGALAKLDPRTAVAAFGSTAGAAKQLGETLRSGPSHEITVFTRTVKQGLVDFIGGQLLPILSSWGSVITRVVLPPLSAVGSVLGAVLVPVLTTVGSALAAGVRWVREYGAWLVPLGVAVAGLTITMNASAIATAAVTAVFSIYRGVILAAAAVTRGYAIAQGVLNAVLTANPIGLIITGIAAFVALLVVAYNKSDRFRAIVQAAWAGIRAGWQVLWDSVLKPGLDGLMIGLQALGAGASWLWSTVLSPVFSAIGLAARVLFAIVATVLIAPLVILFRALGAVAGWLWRAAIKPAFEAIGAFAGWLFNVAVKPVIDGIMSGVRFLGGVITWLWSNIVRPSLSAIGSFFGWLYRVAVKPAIDGVMTTVRALGAGIGWLWNNAVRPSLQFIGDKASWLYRVALKPALDRGRQAVDLFARGFSLARDAIGRAWDQLMGIAKKPVNFIIEWVYTKGIKAVWDKIAGFVGLGSLPAAPKLLAAGGTVGPGWGPAVPMMTNRPTAIVGEGNPNHPEFVIPTDPKYRGRALALWQAAGTQLMADGGIIGGAVDWLGGAARKIGGAVMSGVDFLSDPSKMWERATKFIRDKITLIGQSRWAQLLAKFPLKMLGGLKDKIVNAATSMFGGASADVGGSGVQRWTPVVLQALRMVGQPASLLPVVLRRMNQESGGNPRAINNWDINARNGDPSRGLMQTIGATFNAYAGPLRGRGIYDPLANIFASMRYALARYGSLTAAYNRPGGYAGGGRPRPGEWAWVGERGPELLRFGSPSATVYPHRQSVGMAAGAAARAAAAAASTSRPAAGAAAVAGGLQPGSRLALRIGNREFEAYVEELADAVVEDTLIPVARAIAGRRG